MQINLPYGHSTIPCHIPDEHLQAVLTTNLQEYAPQYDELTLIKNAMAHPIGAKPLHELAKGKQNVVLIASDHTRPVPSRLITPLMLAEIRRGNPSANITIVIATGLHRCTTKAELVTKFGEDIVSHEHIVIHDCDNQANLVSLGTLPSGGHLTINRLVAEADLLVAEGFIEPHFFAGFSGGRKSVLPGVAGRESVMYNHNAGFIASPHCRTGIVAHNPIHRDMLFAAKKAKLAFIVNVVINSHHNVVACFAGDVAKAHEKGRAFLLGLCRVKAKPSDIVVTTNGGYPLDQNIYQAVKGMTTAEAIVNAGGVIIMVAASHDGHGGEGFYATFRDEKNVDTLMQSFLARRPSETILDQWQSQIFARVLQKAKVVYISDAPDDMVRDLHMIPAHSIEEGLKIATDIVKKPNYTVTVIPDGVSIITSVKE